MRTENIKPTQFGEFHITPNFTIKADNLQEREKFLAAGMKEKKDLNT